MMPQKKFYFLSLIILWGSFSLAQSPISPNKNQITVSAGKQYKKSGLGEFFWGKNWRKEWLLPVNVPMVLLDTLYGGLQPYQTSGGGESKSLRLRSAEGKEYTLRSINKTRGKNLPRILNKGPYRNRVQDGISMSHPYAALALPVMLQNAHIYHAKPRLVYVNRQAALDSFNEVFGNDLYLLEERAEGDWRTAAHLGHFKKYISTQEVKDSLKKNNHIKADQRSFIKARLFDVLIGDVDRHEGNWKWGVTEMGTLKFIPVPNDRDQAFFKHDGLLTWMSLAVTRFRWMQSFNYKIRNISKLTIADNAFDRFFTSELNYEDWISSAVALQRSITDSVIAASINQLPAEIMLLSGNELIQKLQYRRDHLQDHAAEYFASMAKRSEVNGTMKKEHFVVRNLSNNEVTVAIYRVDNDGVKEPEPYYQRIFKAPQTKRITIYGFGGEDTYEMDGKIRGMKIIVEKGINKTQFPDG